MGIATYGFNYLSFKILCLSNVGVGHVCIVNMQVLTCGRGVSPFTVWVLEVERRVSGSAAPSALVTEPTCRLLSICPPLPLQGWDYRTPPLCLGFKIKF